MASKGGGCNKKREGNGNFHLSKSSLEVENDEQED